MFAMQNIAKKGVHSIYERLKGVVTKHFPGATPQTPSLFKCCVRPSFNEESILSILVSSISSEMFVVRKCWSSENLQKCDVSAFAYVITLPVHVIPNEKCLCKPSRDSTIGDYRLYCFLLTHCN